MSKISRTCQIELNGHEFQCLKPAQFFVSYFTDGSGGMAACGKHLSKAFDIVLNGQNVGGDMVRVVRIKRR